MSYSTVGSSGDDVTMTITAGMGTNGHVSLTGGWFYPTTLSAGRYLWSRGGVIGLGIDTTTTSLRFITDHTTDGEYTAPASLVTNAWQWAAVMLSCNNALSPPEAVRMWRGDARTPPTELTVTTAVTPVGNTVGTTNWTLGNRGTGTVAFQGQVAENFALSSPVGLLYSLVGTAGTIPNEQAELVRQAILTPLWQAQPELVAMRPYGPWNIELNYFPGEIDGGGSGAKDGQMFSWIGTAPGHKQANYGSAAARSPNAPPYRSIGNWGGWLLVL